jgi:hypothetical protein
MSRIIIKNIGPITEVDLTLNKINVIMGPQSSGKSTIVKIVSFCQWAEKRFILDGNKFDYDFREMFMNFHKISETYFSSKSSFKYESDFLTIRQKGLDFTLKIVSKHKNLDYRKTKNIFIPAERNFVSTIPNLGKYNEILDNIMSFVYDWSDAKKNYTESNPLPILNLDVSYALTTEGDQLTIKNGKKKLLLQHASSGLQSVTPLVMLIDYLTDGFYQELRSNSVNEKEELVKALLDNYNYSIKMTDLLVRDKIDGVTRVEFKVSNRLAERFYKLETNRKRYNFTNFIIEEPEQNLFPTTQRDLIYHLFDRIVNTERPHNLFLTTHSPFILYAINNCVMGKRVSKDMPEDERDELKSHKSWVGSELVSIWEMQNGEIKSVIDEKTGTVTKHYFNEIMSDLMDEYYDMLNYFKYDQ